MKIDRREFGRRVGQSALALGALGAVPSGCQQSVNKDSKRSMLAIVDTHQHLWDLTKFQPPWLEGAQEVLRRSHVTSDYLKESEGLNVTKTVYMEVDVSPSQQDEEAAHVIALSKDPAHPTAAAVISGRPGSPEFEAYIRKYAGNTYVKGVRQVLHSAGTKKGHCLEPQFVKSMQLLGELGMSFDLCMRPTELSDGTELAKRVPGTRFILDHCGNGDPKAFRSPETRGGKPSHEKDQWKRDIAAMAKQDNVICKISGIIASVPEDWSADDLAPIVNHCLDEFGPDRVVFGSDWPVCKIGASFSEWVVSLEAIISNRPGEEQEKLLSKNANRIYRLA